MAQTRRRFLGALAAAGGALLGGCAGTAPAQRGIRGYSVRAIDLHAHWHAPEFVELLARKGNGKGARIGRNEKGLVTLSAPGINSVFQPRYMDLESRIREMNQIGVDIHVLSLTSPMVYWATPDFGLELAEAYNTAASTAHLRYPERFYGAITLPMQSPNLALQELDRASDLPGMRAVYLAEHVNGRNLDDKSFWPIYERCQTLRLPIFLHPVDPVGADRMRSYYLRNFIGNPTDSAIAAASLMFGGVLDAYPDLDVLLPHSGGTFPWLIGRMTHGAAVRPETKHMTKPAISYLRRFHYDTVQHNAEIMMDVIRLVGVDRVAMGSDFPADMDVERPVDFVESLTALSVRDKEMILGRNGARLLRI